MDDVINSSLAGVNSAGRIFCDYAAGMFVQSSVLIAMLLVIDFLLRKRVRATLRYCLWMLVFLKLVLPPTLCLPTGIGYWCGDYLSADSPILQPVSNIGQPESARTRPPQDFALPIEISEPQPSRVLPEAETPAASSVSNIEPVTWRGIVFVVWLAGVLIISILLLQRVRFVRWLIAQSSSADGQLLDLLNQCRGKVGVRRNVELRLSHNTSSPAVCGLFKPIILMPTSLVNDLSPEKLRAVFIHELAHIRRGDLWVNLVQTSLQIIYFYNPLVWLANVVVRRIREQAVDEMVLVALGTEAKSYTNTLIDIAEMAFWRANFSLRLIGVVESKKALKRRIRHMLTRPIPKTVKVGVFGMLVITTIAAVLLPMAGAENRNMSVRKPNSSEASAPAAEASLRRAPDGFSFLYPRLEKGPYTLHGTVTGTDGSAAAGVTVVAFRGEMWEWGLAETVTAQDGSYAFRDLPDGPYHLVAVHADAFAVLPISLGSPWQKGDVLRQDLAVEPFGSTAITGRVLDKKGEPVPDALILSCNGWGSYGRSLALQTRTDPDGCYTIRQWNNKPIIGEPLVAFAQGHEPGLLWNRVSPAVTSDIVLDDGARISGVVRFKDSGEPAPGVTVTLRRRGDLRHPKITTVTDARGAFVFDRLIPYLCALKIDNPKQGYTSTEWPELNLLKDRQVEGLELLISSGASISGTVAVKETGEPLAGVRLWIPNTRPPRVLREAITGPDGRYDLGCLPAGKFTVRCEVPPNVVREYHDPQHGSPRTDKHVSLGPDEHAADVDFSFERGVTVSGRVTDKQGNPVAGARLRANNISSGRPSRRVYTSDVETAADGTYRLTGFVPSKAWNYSMIVSAPGYGLTGSQPFQVTKEISGKDFVPEKAAAVSGRVVDTAGEPIPFAEVRLKSTAEKEYARPVPNPVYADEQGRFTFREGAYPGMYYFEVHLINMGFGPYSTKRAENKPIIIANPDDDREVEVIVASEDRK